MGNDKRILKLLANVPSDTLLEALYAGTWHPVYVTHFEDKKFLTDASGFPILDDPEKIRLPEYETNP